MGRIIHHIKIHFRKSRKHKTQVITSMTCYPEDIRKCTLTMNKILKHPLGVKVKKNFADGEFEIVKIERLGEHGRSFYYK
jgi:NADH:ubiquinone oxidoreductase subunit E